MTKNEREKRCQELANSIAVETDEAKRETLRKQFRDIFDDAALAATPTQGE